jgi:hypothetical protein
MERTHSLKSAQLVTAVGVGAASGVVLPALFHAVGLGPVFLPMHLPVLVAGAVAGWQAGLLCGVGLPWLNHLLTGSPPLVPPVAPLMSVELAAYGTAAGVLRPRFTRAAAEPRLDPLGGWAREVGWLLAALLVGRVALGLAAVALGPALGLRVPPAVYVWSALVTGAPGIALQVVLVPVVVRRLSAGRDRGKKA